tara:strand:+ start:12344 stop:12559 length:216 start_codon:yes stop_codon:yes gene_type:complete
MGSLFGGAAPPPPGPSATEIRLEAEAAKKLADEAKRKEEQDAQKKLNQRGRRSLLSEENTGEGFPGPTTPV